MNYKVRLTNNLKQEDISVDGNCNNKVLSIEIETKSEVVLRDFQTDDVCLQDQTLHEFCEKFNPVIFIYSFVLLSED